MACTDAWPMPREATPPTPSSSSRATTIARLTPGDVVTLPHWSATRLVRVTSRAVDADGHRLSVTDDVEHVEMVAQGAWPAIIHDHLTTSPEGIGDALEVNAMTEPTRVELGPAPALQRVEHPYTNTIDFRGITIYVENPAGSVRRGVDADGKPWSITMRHHYGEIPQAIGADNDPLDVYVGPDLSAPEVYVFQTKLPGRQEFDEVKVFLGFSSRKAAAASFYAHYNRPGFLYGVSTWTFEDFRRELATPTTRGKMRYPGDAG